MPSGSCRQVPWNHLIYNLVPGSIRLLINLVPGILPAACRLIPDNLTSGTFVPVDKSWNLLLELLSHFGTFVSRLNRGTFVPCFFAASSGGIESISLAINNSFASSNYILYSIVSSISLYSCHF